MAYTIISQNNNTTTLTDGVNTITVPSRVNLTSGNFTIVEVNNNMATLEDGDGNVYRDIPCVATLVDAGGGGSALPDQTGHSGEFLTTDGTDASWGQLIPQKYDSSQHYFYLTDRTNPDIKSGAIVIGSGGNSPRPNAVSQDCVCIGTSSCVYNSVGAVLIGKGQVQGSLSGIALNGGLYSGSWYSIAIGGTVNGVKCAMQFGNGVNSETGTVCFALSADNGATFTNYKLLDSDGTIPTARFTTDPVSDGTYVPTLTISSGVATRSWSAPSGGLPSQTGNAGKFLTTDGTDASWSDKPLVNTATGTNALTILGSSSTASQSINIGVFSQATRTSAITIGTTAKALHDAAIAIGANSVAGASSGASSNWDEIAIGNGAEASAKSAIQLGYGTNNDADTFQVWNHRLLNRSDGTIPTARLTKVNTTVTLTSAGWSGGSQSVTVSGMTATGVVLVSPDPTDQSAYTSAGIICTAQAADSLTFTCSTTPSADIDVNVVML